MTTPGVHHLLVHARRPASARGGGTRHHGAGRRWRRRLLATAGAGLAAVVLGACGSSASPSGTPPTTSSQGNSATTAASAAARAAQTRADSAAVAAGCPSNPATTLTKPHWNKAPAMTIDRTKTYTATVTTDVGSFVITLDAAKAPLTVNNFVFLADRGFYNCIVFHRVIPGFMEQTGDPTGTGTGGPGYEFADELPAAANPQYPVGSVAMANAGPNTNGSQFFIVTGAEGESLPPSYSLFGQVTSGMNVVQQIDADGNRNPADNGVPPTVLHRMLKVTITAS